SFWTDVRAIHDRVAAEQAVWIFQIVQTLARCFVTRVGNETIGLQQTSRTDELVGVPPERWARGRAAGAQNALVQTIALLTGFRRLQTLFLWRRSIVDQERLDRMVLVEEVGHVHDQVTDNRQTWQWAQNHRLFQVAHVGGAGQPVLAIDVHGIGTAHTFTAGATQRQAVVHVIFNAQDRIEQHLVGRFQLDFDLLHVGTLVLVRIVAVDFKFDLTFLTHVCILLRKSGPWAESFRLSEAASRQACTPDGCLPRTTRCDAASFRRHVLGGRSGHEHRDFQYEWRPTSWWREPLRSCWPLPELQYGRY